MVEHLGTDVPMHFTAFHPDWKMRDIPSTPASTLSRARRIALEHGVRYPYTGNVHDATGSSTYCHHCNALLIERDWYQLGHWGLTDAGTCEACDAPLAGHFEAAPDDFGPTRIPIRMQNFH
jgi:pyruvate formate lyase activating enzyme